MTDPISDPAPSPLPADGPVGRGVLGVVGDLVEDVVVWFDGALRPADDNPARITRTRGGSAANVAAFAAGLGAAARFIGRVGDDPLGAQLVASLSAAGVEVRAQRGGRSGTIVVLVGPDGERTMFPDRGAAAELADVPFEWLDGLGLLHATSYSFAAEPAASATVELLSAARAAGIPVSLDASSSGLLLDLGVPRYVEFIERVRPMVFFANAAEASLLELDRPPFSRMLTIVKHGSEPTIVRTPEGRSRAIPVPAVERVRDATGAGDAFAAGVLSARLAGHDVAAAVRRGHLLARAVLGSPGAAVGGAPHPDAASSPHPTTLEQPVR